MPVDWIVKRHAGVSRFEIQFPEITAPPGLSPYVRVSANNVTEVLRTAIRRGARENQVWVALSSRLPADAPAVFQPVPEWRYQTHRMLYYRPLRLAVAGAALGILGLWIEAAVALGQYVVLVPMGEWWLTFWRTVSFVLKGIGILVPTVIAVLRESA